MRIRAMLATAAIVGATLTALPAIASNPSIECPGGTFAGKYGDQLQFEEGVDIADLVITRTKSGREVMAFTWTSDAPISQFVVKAGKVSTTVLVNNATSGTFAVPAKYAVSHVTFCYGEDTPPPPPVVTPAGRARFVCWGSETGGYYAIFAYNNISTDSTGANVAVDRATASFATSHAGLADQFPTTFLHTGTDTSGSAIEFTVSGWDGAQALTFSLFGTTKTASLSNQSQECF